MDEKLFPAEIVKYTTEYHYQRYNPKTVLIYQILLSIVLISFLSLFFVKVDVSVKALGILRAVSANHAVKSIVSGRIEEVFVKEGEVVEAGQVLARIKADVLDQERDRLTNEQHDLLNQLSDLQKLTALVAKRSFSGRPTLSSAVYSQQFTFFWQKITKLQNQQALAKRNFERYEKLYENRVISVAEYEEMQFIYQQASTELELAYDEQGAVWQQELSALRLKTGELGSQIEQVGEQRGYYTLQSPAIGTVQAIKGLRSGSLVSANEVLAEISPDSGIIVETYVPPKDIGYLKVGTPVTLQIDAYNYNQWGMASGTVTAISADVFTDNDQPYFKVRCALHENKLVLKNGYEGTLKKGMTLQARFFITKRTLFQLLYDKADDWLNPNIIPDKLAGI